MKTEQYQWSKSEGWLGGPPSGAMGAEAQLVLIFGGAEAVEASGGFERARKAYPRARIVGCSTAGEIHGARVRENTVALTAVGFDHSRVAAASVPIADPEKSFEAGRELAGKFPADGLRHLLVFSEGLTVNGSDLVDGLNSALPAGVEASGGFAGDGNRLQMTHVLCDGKPRRGVVAAAAFYGERLRIGVAATAGWGPFGPDRLVTKSRKNVLYEFDGRPALALYKQYLGEFVESLPASALMFPLELRVGRNHRRILRAVLAVDEAEQSMTFAGNIPEGSYARLMRGRIEELIEGTYAMAKASAEPLQGASPQLAIAVSCNGRRMVLRQRVEEEVEAVQSVLGPQTPLTGFYSYGEIGPPAGGGTAELHNETMTLTTFAEA